MFRRGCWWLGLKLARPVQNKRDFYRQIWLVTVPLEVDRSKLGSCLGLPMKLAFKPSRLLKHRGHNCWIIWTIYSCALLSFPLATMIVFQVLHQGLAFWLATGLLVATVVHLFHRAYFSGLRSVPGPWLAKFSTLHRILIVRRGQGPGEYRKLHSAYGRIVRTGPNHVSVSDPDMIPVIYGIGKKFNKVMKPYVTTSHTL